MKCQEMLESNTLRIRIFKKKICKCEEMPFFRSTSFIMNKIWVVILCGVILFQFTHLILQHQTRRNIVAAFQPSTTNIFFRRPIPGGSSCGFEQSEKNRLIETKSNLDSNINSGNVIKGKKRRRRRKDKIRFQKGTSKLDKHRNCPVSEEELAHHVSTMYVKGPGGKMKQIEIKRQRQSSANITDETKKHNEYMRMLDRHPTLVLNADYQPLSVLPLSLWSWQETVKSLFSGKVQVVDVYPDVTVRAVNMDVPLPSVIALTEFVKQPHQQPAFTRRNVFLRDGYVCQYCGNRFKTQDLSLDHVAPRCVGGKTTWQNTVTCCKKCNGRKGSTLPSDLWQVKRMKLIREPRVPSKYELAAEAEKMMPRRVHPTWKPFLGFVMLPEIKSLDSRSNIRSSSYFDFD